MKTNIASGLAELAWEGAASGRKREEGEVKEEGREEEREELIPIVDA
jgi:hypothetical protein